MMIDERLSFTDHIHDKINKAYAMLGVIKRNFKHLTTTSFILPYKNMVRSHLDYCSSVWSQHKKANTENLGKVQKRATKLLPELKKRHTELQIDYNHANCLHFTIEGFEVTLLKYIK